ncbi:MAG TPA: glycosyltransferase family 87 protein [Acetobacteraceae bacterium]
MLDDPDNVVLFMTTICMASVLWLGATVLVSRRNFPDATIRIVLPIAIAMRLITFATPPLLSTDIYRYVWDGRVQLAGINPYRFIPDAPQLAFLRDATVFPSINRADYAHTIYPPAAETIYAIAAAVAPGVYGMKAAMAGFDILAVACLSALLRDIHRSRAALLIYAWCPLPVWEFAGSGHIDAAAAGLLALALLLAARGRHVPLGITLTLATLTKFLPGVVLPAFWRPGRWRVLAAFVVTAMVLYLPYIGIGRRVLGFLPGYTTEEGLRTGQGIFLLDVLSRIVPMPAWTSAVYFVTVLTILAALACRFAFVSDAPEGPEQRARQAGVLGAVLLVAVSPHYPWYFGWLAPLACLAPLASVLWLLAAAPLLAHGSTEYLFVPATVYVPAAALAVRDLHKSRNATKSIIATVSGDGR